MSFGAIQFGGLASGLDTRAIIDAILQFESRPIFSLQGQKETEKSKLSLLGTFEGLVKGLQTKAQDLSNGFFAHSLQEGTAGVATFSLSSGAASGSHSLTVNSLAEADRFTLDTTAPVIDPDAALGTGTISFDYEGTSYTVDIVAGSDSLNAVAAAINGVAEDAVQASVINVGTEADPDYQLVLAAQDTGVDFAIQNLSVSVGGFSGTTQIGFASNAEVVIDGLTVERSSNEFTDVVPGVSFTVSSAGDALSPVTTTFTVGVDVEGSKERVQELVDAYNEVIDFVNEQNEYDTETGPGGDLFGDSALTSVRSAINTALFDVDIADVVADTEGYSTLGLIGIDLGTDGRLSIDDAVFDEKLEGNLKAFGDLFDDPTDGLLGKLDLAISDLIKSSINEFDDNIPGLFDRRETTINSIVSDIDDQIERMERRLESIEAGLVQKFANLEQIVGGLNSQAAFLSSGLAFPTS